MGKKQQKKTKQISVNQVKTDCSGLSKESDYCDSINYAFRTLERIDSWITNCDNKLSLLIGACGIVMTIFLSTDSLSKVYFFLQRIIKDRLNVYGCIFLFSIIVLSVFYVITFVHVICAIMARIDSKKYIQDKISDYSLLYFGSICSKKYSDFKKLYLTGSEQDKLNDILAQIYINSSIASKKFEHYNKCLKWIVISSVSTIGLLIWGVLCF